MKTHAFSTERSYSPLPLSRDRARLISLAVKSTSRLFPGNGVSISNGLDGRRLSSEKYSSTSRRLLVSRWLDGLPGQVATTGVGGVARASMEKVFPNRRAQSEEISNIATFSPMARSVDGDKATAK